MDKSDAMFAIALALILAVVAGVGAFVIKAHSEAYPHQYREIAAEAKVMTPSERAHVLRCLEDGRLTWSERDSIVKMLEDNELRAARESLRQACEAKP